jgi:hypothetical protein
VESDPGGKNRYEVVDGNKKNIYGCFCFDILKQNANRNTAKNTDN